MVYLLFYFYNRLVNVFCKIKSLRHSQDRGIEIYNDISSLGRRINLMPFGTCCLRQLNTISTIT